MVYLCRMRYLALIACAWMLFQCRQASESTASNDSTKTEEKKEVVATIGAQPGPDSLRGSVKARAIETFGNGSLTVNYYSPAVRDRIIWGGLVPFEKVWVTGAHNATYLEINTPIAINGQSVPSGNYAFFTIPGRTKWIVILNTRWRQHLADSYNEKEDVLRLVVQPETNAPHQERLRYVVNKKSDREGELIVHWEKVRITVPFEVAHP
jgi:hypothetical protein